MQLPTESERRIRKAIASTYESLRIIESLTRTINLTIRRFNKPMSFPDVVEAAPESVLLKRKNRG